VYYAKRLWISQPRLLGALNDADKRVKEVCDLQVVLGSAYDDPWTWLCNAHRLAGGLTVGLKWTGHLLANDFFFISLLEAASLLLLWVFIGLLPLLLISFVNAFIVWVIVTLGQLLSIVLSQFCMNCCHHPAPSSSDDSSEESEQERE